MEINKTIDSLYRSEFQHKTPLFTGGTKFGNIKAFYYQDGEHPIEFEFFELREGKVFGRGDDDVGPFTVEGSYNIENFTGVISMEKKYISQHTVRYEGTILLKPNVYELEGTWKINLITGNFSKFLYPGQTSYNSTDNLVERKQPSVCDNDETQGYRNSIDISAKGNGYYIQNGEKFEMSFDNLALVNGRITGRGNDGIGNFLIDGEYHDIELLGKVEIQFSFKKHYEGMHEVFYSGVLTQTENGISLDGHWSIDKLSDFFYIELSLTYMLPTKLDILVNDFDKILGKVQCYLKVKIQCYLNI